MPTGASITVPGIPDRRPACPTLVIHQRERFYWGRPCPTGLKLEAGFAFSVVTKGPPGG